jgi:hypothetical protein
MLQETDDMIDEIIPEECFISTQQVPSFEDLDRNPNFDGLCSFEYIENSESCFDSPVCEGCEDYGRPFAGLAQPPEQASFTETLHRELARVLEQNISPQILLSRTYAKANIDFDYGKVSICQTIVNSPKLGADSCESSHGHLSFRILS